MCMKLEKNKAKTKVQVLDNDILSNLSAVYSDLLSTVNKAIKGDNDAIERYKKLNSKELNIISGLNKVASISLKILQLKNKDERDGHNDGFMADHSPLSEDDLKILKVFLD